MRDTYLRNGGFGIFMHMLAASMAQLGSVNLAARKGVHQEMRIKGQKV